MGKETDDVTGLLSGLNVNDDDDNNLLVSPVRQGPLLPHSLVSLINDKLKMNIKDASRFEEDDPVFDELRDLARLIRLPKQAAENMVKLACGYRAFPPILLENPSNYNAKNYEDMFFKGSALCHLREILREIGLNEKDVPILDLIPLLNKGWMVGMDRSKKEEEKNQLMKGVTNLVLKLIKKSRPLLLVSGQCAGKEEYPSICSSEIVQALSSSIAGAEMESYREVEWSGFTFYVVQAFHPSKSAYAKDTKIQNELETTLTGILKTVYAPCAEWERQYTQYNGMAKTINQTMVEIERLREDLGELSFRHKIIYTQLREDKPKAPQEIKDLKERLDSTVKVRKKAMERANRVFNTLLMKETGDLSISGRNDN